MKVSRIIGLHLITALVCILLYYIFIFILPDVSKMQKVFYIALAVFGFFSFSICFFASQLAGHKNKTIFNSIILLSSLFKIGISVVLVMATKDGHKEMNLPYIIVFLITYISFTIVETAILQRLAKQSNKIWKQKT